MVRTKSDWGGVEPGKQQDTRRSFLLKTSLAAGGMAATGGAVCGGLALAGDEHGRPEKATATGHGGGSAGFAARQQEVQAPPFGFSGVTMPRRKSFFEYTQAEVNQLAAAYGRMKALPQNDPRYWLNQANIHAAHCGGGEFTVHGGWFFTVWHRCYLFFYERILASLSDSPSTFALPYWDWSNHPMIPNTQFNQSQGLPSPFFNQNSPLFDPNRGPGPNNTFNDDPLQTGVAQATSPSNMSGILADDFEDFGGSDPNDPNGRGMGDLENAPHGSVHTWTGIAGSDFHDMGNLTFAARDLLFFLHHANVERWFTLWLSQGFPLPSPASPWYQQWFNFWDEKGNPVSVTVQDAMTNMPGNYLQPQQSFTLVNQPQEVPIGGAPRSVTSAVVPESLRQRIASAATRSLETAPQAATRRAPKIQLQIEGIEAPHNVPVILHVFLNKPDATAKDSTGPNCVGTIHLVPSSGAAGMHHRPINATLNITAKAGLLRLDGPGKGPTVTLVPVDTRHDRSAVPPVIKFRAIRVTTKN
jgi:polyphenol oxidase